MAVDRAEIAGTVRAYLLAHPDQRERLARLEAALADGSALTERTTFTGHVTCGALILNAERRALHIHHNVLRRWLLPGGHLEPGDTDLRGAALREAYEETGLSDLRPLGDGAPADIDVHRIPANPARGEPEHWHFDFRYAFELVGDPPIRLPADEVSGYAWR